MGVTLACVFAQRDGYSHWYKRLLYFTQQSNIWIGIVCFLMAILSIMELVNKKSLIKRYMYVLKFIFAVSITITGVIFCGLLAPFADYDVWHFSSVLTHVVVPVLAIIDYFVNYKQTPLKRSHIFLSLIPPSLYFIFAMTLSAFKVDFGRGDTFPYFFINFYSEVGLFGFTNEGELPQLGTAYWVMAILALILNLGYLYYRVHPTTIRAIKEKKQRD